ncbi:MAG: metallophosphoesterase, partial [Acidimicrobiales bacterium]|nr:metallophosphoesterase [Acidimicrobiales bacterium]
MRTSTRRGGAGSTPLRRPNPLSVLFAALLIGALVAPAARAQTAVQFDGTNDHVTMGQAAALGAPTFTLELWFQRLGAGVTTSTGTGGVTAIPLLTKGRGEADGDTRDMNYFLGIRGTDNVLVADFEEGGGQTQPGLNHPVAGTTPIVTGVWYHAAATYDGTTWRLYLNGRLDGTAVVGASRLPQAASLQHFGLGTALTSTGVAAGYFNGVIDEARVWGHARPGQGILDSLTLEIASAPGLLGRWSFDEGAGTVAGNSVAGSPAGTLVNGPTWVAGAPFELPSALDFNGTSGYVALGDPAVLDLAQFTVETWFRRDGAGTTTTTGTGGVTDAIPLVTKGRGEAETSNVDLNWFLGLRGADGVLCADFEEGAAGASPSLNHPVIGVTPVTTGVWHHAAVTYDGATWNLYLDGNLETTLVVGQPCASASTQPAALGSALTSAGTPAGYFDGALDEVRVWNVARSIDDIRGTANIQLDTPQAGLVARWALDEGLGTAVGGSAGTSVNGTVLGANYAWVAPAPFDLAFNDPPAMPVLVGPADGATGVPVSTPLQVAVSDPDGDSLTVAFYGRPLGTGPGPDFTIIPIPDTQYYTSELNGGRNAILKAQTDWIVAERASRNIVYAVQLGDCTDTGSDLLQWLRADTSFSRLEDPLTTGLPDGVPFGICVGNHDQTPIADADGSTEFYNAYFGIARFNGRAYYGGPHRGTNDNWFELFSGGGLEFIAIGLEYDTSPDAAVLDWADSLLKAHPGRRALVATHHGLGTGNPGTFSAQGSAIYEALKDNPNFFLLLCGHVAGEGRRQDVFEGRTVHTLMSDYQTRTNGGNGWLRILEFSPAQNVIRVRTYSPWLGQFEADADSSSQFTLAYDMGGGPGFTLLGTVRVASGETASLVWPGLTGLAGHEWYATSSDGRGTATSPVWDFTTAETQAPLVDVLFPDGGETLRIDQVADLQWSASDDVGVTTVDVQLSRSGPAGPFEDIALGIANSGSLSWTVTGPVTSDAWLRVVARDAAGNAGSATSAAAFAIDAAVDAGPRAVTEFALGAVTPNPARGAVRFGFALPRDAAVRVCVLDVQGREVARL